MRRRLLTKVIQIEKKRKEDKGAGKEKKKKKGKGKKASEKNEAKTTRKFRDFLEICEFFFEFLENK